jgi:apolipoprotein N-acyltransferase
METSRALDVSRPEPLRVAGFLVTVTGALLAGIGSVLTWLTTGFAGLESPSKGTDLWEGSVVLACAVVMLVAVLVTRMAASGGLRKAAAAIVIVAGLVILGVAGSFWLTSKDDEPALDAASVAAIAEAADLTEDEVRTRFRESLDELGVFSEVGPGPGVAALGGLAGAIGGVLVLAWVVRRPDDADGEPGGAETAPSEVP